MKRQCARCGVHIKEETNRIWCDRCIQRVNEELEGKADREWRYYFRWHLRHKKTNQTFILFTYGGEGTT